MAQQNILDKLRDWIGGVGLNIFLWSVSLTLDEYIDLLIRDAEQRHGADLPQHSGLFDPSYCEREGTSFNPYKGVPK